MKNFNKLIQTQFQKMCETGKLFRANISGEKLYEIYLNSFTKEQDPIFRDPQSSTHNCNLCNNFLRRYGNIVAVDENLNIITMFDVEIEYSNTAKVLSNTLKKLPILSVFFETYNELNSLPYEATKKNQLVYRLGVDKNHKRYTKEESDKFGVVKPNEIVTFNHLHLDLPTQYVDSTNRSIEQIIGFYRDKYEVFKRGMQINLDTLELVRDLINQNSLLDGTSHLGTLQEVINLKKEFDKLRNYSKISVHENWYWVATYHLSERVAKFRNTLLGTLCVELSEGEELNKACLTWNKRVDPANYMKASAPITRLQIEQAMKKKYLH